MSHSKILFILSGSIAAFKAAQVISRLVQDGNEVQTVATPSALKFIGAATLEGLTGKPVLTDLWENGRAMDHIHLSRWADFGVLCPASANTIAKFASGYGDDLVSTLFLAWPAGKPFHIFPAMNVEMLANPATQTNMGLLASRGCVVHGTGAGTLACGEEGAGRLLEPEKILELLRVPVKGRVLMTSGATRESIDGIRFLSNVSTGQTGAALADSLSARGWQVTYLHGVGAQMPSSARVPSSAQVPSNSQSPSNARPISNSIRGATDKVFLNSDSDNLTFTDFKDLDARLREQLSTQSYDAVIHCAAVSDYSIAQVNGADPAVASKLSSEDELSLKMKRNHKLLPLLKEYSKNKNIVVIGFKLTLNSSQNETAEIATKMISENVDAVVANDWSVVDRDRSRHPGEVIGPKSRESFNDLTELGSLLDSFIEKKTSALKASTLNTSAPKISTLKERSHDPLP